jgi:hypothetical protein
MAFVTYLKQGEGIKIGDAVFILQSERGARIVLEADQKTVITKMTKEEVQNERWRKQVKLSRSISKEEDSRNIGKE